MRTLFEIDRADYDPSGTVFRRPSVRGIIRCEGGRLALVHSRKYDYVKFPGGGMEAGESHADALVREIREETGLTVHTEAVLPYGMVRRKERGLTEDIFIQENYYYICETDSQPPAAQTLDDYEADEQFTLVYFTPEEAIRRNRQHLHGEKTNDAQFRTMLERDTRILEMLMRDFAEYAPAAEGRS